MTSTLKTIIACFTLISTFSFSQINNTITPTSILKFSDKYWSLDVYATVPLKQCGWGMGVGVFGPGKKIGMINPYLPIHLRFGGDFYFAELDRKHLGTLPLSAPQLGDAKVRLSQTNIGLNVAARFSIPYSKKFTPYIDLFVGYRYFGSGMSITPLQKQEEYEESTSNNLTKSNQFCYGGATGVLVYLGPCVRFNAGLMITSSNKLGEITDIARARVESGNIIAQKINTPKDMFILKVGFTFILDCEDNRYDNDCKSGHSKTYRTSSSSSTRGTWSGGKIGGGTKSNSVKINVRPSK
ncbi:MAG: hypothetical protein SGJ15_08855 [Bacteroidota bacterium]|nr:hypothetical protein [Bacteroidota bacterium]